MEKNLERLIQSSPYRESLGLPGDVKEHYELLAQGEYNQNYVFVHPIDKRKLVLRVNYGSQIHLSQQISYEAKALKALEVSGRTPKVYYVDDSKSIFERGILVEDYLPGRLLHYERDLPVAAEILADIHSTPVAGKDLIISENPLKEILQECETMFAVYKTSPLAKKSTKETIGKMLKKAWDIVEKTNFQALPKCIINTELNNTNFLINEQGKSYLIDWEKPLIGDPAQDLGHFLAPTTTFWKTDVILDSQKQQNFVQQYLAAVDGRFHTDGIKDRVELYTKITCMRGITWCAMAWVQYRQSNKLITNTSTDKKLDAYLDSAFLGKIERFMCEGIL